ncbi:MAG: hypothetical protein GY847_06625 [Proteobacteria bacterium]|nr:hypothetical protein [Pseudomonadota bacterium]
MDREQAYNKLGKPIQMAKVLLGETVRHFLDFDENSHVNIQELTEIVGKGLGILLRVHLSETSCQSYSAGAGDAMDHLQRALELIKFGNLGDPAVVSATEKLAKTLAILYPLSRVLKKPSGMPEHPAKALEKPPEFERRSTQRIVIEAEIGFQSEISFFVGAVENFSTGGLFLATDNIREIGSKLSVSFTLPSGHFVSVEGTIRWVRKYNEAEPNAKPGMGVQFEMLPADDQEAIDNFIAQLPPPFCDE